MGRTRSTSLARNLALAYALLIAYACLHPLSGWRMSGLPLFDYLLAPWPRYFILEDLLFTHRGLSGPGVLQISSYWQEGTPIRLNLAPGMDITVHLNQAKATSRKLIANELAGLVPSRLADTWVAQGAALGHNWQRPINEASDKALTALAERLTRWELTPTGTEGYRKAEVTAGGVDTKALSSQTLESRQPGLYFIGEVVDVTGHLGGFNFQWAWSSAVAAGQAL